MQPNQPLHPTPPARVSAGVRLLERQGRVNDARESLEIDDDLRKELTEYYKWVVSLATFVLTISASIAGTAGYQVEYRWTLGTGWVLLCVCIFFNWLIIKRLITMPVVVRTPDSQAGAIHRIFRASHRNLKYYGSVQNLAFLFGTLLVVLGFLLNLLAH